MRLRRDTGFYRGGYIMGRIMSLFRSRSGFIFR